MAKSHYYWLTVVRNNKFYNVYTVHIYEYMHMKA